MHTLLEDNGQINGLTAHAMLWASAHTENIASVDAPPKRFLSHFVATLFGADSSSDK